MKLTPINPHFNACDQPWELMPEQAGGRLCHACERVLVDFTGMTEQEMLNLQRENHFKLCGRFTQNQVDRIDRYLTLQESQRKTPWLVSLLMASSVLAPMAGSAQNPSNTTPIPSQPPVSTAPNKAQPPLPNTQPPLDTLYVEGIVKDYVYGTALPFAELYIHASSTYIKADSAGIFRFKAANVPDKNLVTVSYAGFTTKWFSLRQTPSQTLTLELQPEGLDPVVIVEYHPERVRTHTGVPPMDYMQEPSLKYKMGYWLNPAHWYQKIRYRVLKRR